MRIDRQSAPWIVGCGGVWIAATGAFLYLRLRTDHRWDAGSWAGLAFGAAGFAAMLVAMLLAARKQLRSRLLGRAYFWMQAHVWIGLLSYPLILYHAGGFSWGGELTQLLMWILLAVFVSGIVGIMIQQAIPPRLMRYVPAETIAEQITSVQAILRDEAEKIIRGVRTSEPEASPSGGVAVQAREMTARAFLVSFYESKIVPFLGDRYVPSSPLAFAASSREAFASLRKANDAALNAAASQLETLVDERRQLQRQRRLHRVLHGWLIFHVPLSYFLMVLATIHAVMSMRYMPTGK